MDKKQFRKFIKITAVIYIASFLVFNWNDVSWIFNYKAVAGILDDFFNPYPGIDALAMDKYFYPNRSVQENRKNDEPGKTIQAVTRYTEKQNVLEIPSIGISVPIIFSQSVNLNAITKDLDSGVVFYPGSVYPGQTGQMVVLGHSAPPNWPKIKHDWVFSDLNSLGAGDKIYINLNNKQYAYEIKKKIIINRGAEVPASENAKNNNVLTLISCWPPGKDYQRIAVVAELTNN